MRYLNPNIGKSFRLLFCRGELVRVPTFDPRAGMGEGIEKKETADAVGKGLRGCCVKIV